MVQRGQTCRGGLQSARAVGRIIMSQSRCDGIYISSDGCLDFTRAFMRSYPHHQLKDQKRDRQHDHGVFEP